jgi:hypothetical protein
MSEKVVTLEKVQDAITQIEKIGANPSADRVREITRGSKSTVLPLYKQAMEARMKFGGAAEENTVMAPPSDLHDAIQKAVKSISAIAPVFMDELKRHDEAISYHSKEELSREMAMRDLRISQLEEELGSSRSAQREALQKVDTLERELAWANRYIVALEAGDGADEAIRASKGELKQPERERGSVVHGARRCVDYAEPFLIRPKAFLTQNPHSLHRNHPFAPNPEANDDW